MCGVRGARASESLHHFCDARRITCEFSKLMLTKHFYKINHVTRLQVGGGAARVAYNGRIRDNALDRKAAGRW